MNSFTKKKYFTSFAAFSKQGEGKFDLASPTRFTCFNDFYPVGTKQRSIEIVQKYWSDACENWDLWQSSQCSFQVEIFSSKMQKFLQK